MSSHDLTIITNNIIYLNSNSYILKQIPHGFHLIRFKLDFWHFAFSAIILMF